jgi:Phenazine biosynthesis-like protein
MREYPFAQVDAFTSQRLSGNPCAIVFDADDLDAPTMLAIAREMNLSETAFVRRSAVADVGARYFTTSEEIPLAGHPTIATIFALVESGRIQAVAERTTITLELPAGIIPVEIGTAVFTYLCCRRCLASLRAYTRRCIAECTNPGGKYRYTAVNGASTRSCSAAACPCARRSIYGLTSGGRVL